MLSDYKVDQLLAYNLFFNDIANNCVTHAYLIDENDYVNSFDMILSFVKSILCNNRIDGCNCNQCSICKRINDGNYTELKIIESDGMFIKKQQIIDLQQEFSRTIVEGNKKIYIIRACERMRAEAANSMLKFLEEPDNNVIAILTTNNINNVLSTIISRCKVIKFNRVLNDNNFVDEELKNLAIKFISSVEECGINTIIDIKDIWFSVISSKNRERMVSLFDIMIDIYYDAMKVIIGGDKLKHSNYSSVINKFIDINTVETILGKINILLEYKDSIKYNVNNNLLVDSLVISIGGISNGCRN